MTTITAQQAFDGSLVIVTERGNDGRVYQSGLGLEVYATNEGWRMVEQSRTFELAPRTSQEYPLESSEERANRLAAYDRIVSR